jgi:dipeptidyl aminopeptidase/acylaminoacyl peptidase
MPGGMIPADLYRIRWSSDPNLSPDGSKVAFTVTQMDAESDDYRSAIWTVRTEAGSAATRFTWSDARDSTPRWSPDGSRLAFLSTRSGGKAQLFVIDARGGEARELTSIAEGVSSPVWSPDGSRIALVARVPPERTDNGSAPPSKNPPARVITALKYRANGEGFTYDRRRHIFVVEPEANRVSQITDGDWDDIQPAWSPDSSSVAFVSARHEGRDYDHATDLFVVSASGGNPERLTPEGGHVALPAWSPDGGQIAYLGYRDAEDAPLNSRLWLIGAAGGEPQCLSPGFDRQLEISDTCPPVWSTDGTTIYTGAEDRGTAGVLAIEIGSGSAAWRIAGERSVSGFSLSTDSRIAFVTSDPRNPGDVHVRDRQGERRLSDLNAGWRAETELQMPQHFEVESDGNVIDAWMVKPAGFEPGRMYPALVNIHGGPFSQYGWAFLDEFQVESGAGYAVVYCNPRGSSGRDDAFARAIIGAPGEPDSADILAVADAAVDRYDFIDRARIGVLGGSYGGYLTSWIVGHTGQFAAACSERALNNRYSKEGTSDIWSGFTYLRTRQWQDPALYARFSPISYVCEMYTPLLILHSEEDIRCPIEQAEQLFVALKQLRREVLFVRFPGENHELSRNGKPSHRVQRFEHIVKWFGDHLQATPAVPEGERAPAGGL